MSTDAAAPARTWRVAAVTALILLAAVLATLWPVLSNEPVWDDADVTINNPYVHSLAGLGRLVSKDSFSASASEEASPYYRPLGMISFLVNTLVGGSSAASYHAGNLVLHTLNALLVAALIARSLGAPSRAAVLGPALLFAIAPINVEAVAWISGRFDVVGTTFALAALVANAGSGPRARAGAILAVAAALFCKETLIATPLLIYLQDALVARRPARGEASKYAAMAGLVGLMLLARWLVGVPSASAAASVGVPALIQGYAFVLETFARALVYPAYLDPFRTYVAPGVGVTALVLATSLAACAAAVRALYSSGADRRVHVASFALSWVLVALAPAAIVGAKFDIVGERYAYFPLVGAFLALASLMDATRGRVATALAAGLVGVAALGCSWRSRTRARDWQTEATLYAASLRDDPDNPYALYALGELDARAGRFPRALARLTRSLEKSPGSARAWTALCYAHLNLGQPALAERECERSVALQPANPRAWINLAGARVNQRAWQAGLEAATHASSMKPRSAEAHYLRAACLANLGALPEARDEVGAALAIDPDHAGASNLLRQLQARGIP